MENCYKQNTLSLPKWNLIGCGIIVVVLCILSIMNLYEEPEVEDIWGGDLIKYGIINETLNIKFKDVYNEVDVFLEYKYPTDDSLVYMMKQSLNTPEHLKEMIILDIKTALVNVSKKYTIMDASYGRRSTYASEVNGVITDGIVEDYVDGLPPLDSNGYLKYKRKSIIFNYGLGVIFSNVRVKRNNHIENLIKAKDLLERAKLDLKIKELKLSSVPKEKREMDGDHTKQTISSNQKGSKE